MPKRHLMSGYEHFRREYFSSEATFLRKLAVKGQAPGAMYVGCSDSRVIPELLMNARPGELFVVRNVANLIPPFEAHYVSVGAAVEFAITSLRVPHLIVCGHDGCGGIRATLDGLDRLSDTPNLQKWLEAAVPAVERARVRGLPPEDEARSAVEENVLCGMDNLITYPAVARALGEGRLQLHGWVFDLAHGAIRVYDVAREEFVPYSEVS
jgi:carbonic anhydrase